MDALAPADLEAEPKTPLLRKAARAHARVPYLRHLPFAAVAVIVAVAGVNALVWACVGGVLHFHPALISSCVLSYTLGLRHALDADHISAIDLMTRRLIASGQRPVTVGMFFSLGHSTIVIITSIVVAATASALTSRFDSFSRIGGIIGSSVSAAFLLILGLANTYILFRLVQQLQRLTRTAPDSRAEAAYSSPGLSLQASGGCMSLLLKRVFRLVDRPWKMYPLGVLFGLGFDTSSEIALLGLASLHAAGGTSVWLILLFPALFTAAMCLLDTADGALMMGLYTSARLASDTLAVLYYSVVLTALTVVVAVVIGAIQLLTLVANVAHPQGVFWDGVDRVGERYEVVGAAICASFLVVGVASVALYGPWRARIDRRRALLGHDDDDDGDDSSNTNTNINGRETSALSAAPGGGGGGGADDGDECGRGSGSGAQRGDMKGKDVGVGVGERA
ncbi:uncharacterized protein K452DRAFT_338869 [Aplosporella prunicola CBS 121167]|uniref:Nickel/cobalt efflux system n=1 Tax=Aplosporella prunicola CBS 121167 TaxID=1176127 RepID=A0A6A6B4V9_9PEZI|nr:uncharacterized protein K452DRAFT_338869 [Aplosporella prunicola CBS 121167]KAF2138234.1 hypothetical protein K452DRAFT_338869 [Aplosporella prunicola CBS 121167]